MLSRRVALVALAALVAAARPAIADDLAANAPAAPIAPAAVGRGGVAPRVGMALTIVGGVLTLASVYLVVRGYQHRNDLNPDASIAETGYGVVIGVPSLLTTVVGVALLIPDDAGSGPSSHPRFAELPRGLALRFTF
jgi:hypothetical protein